MLLTNSTNTLVLQTQRKSGKCDNWCCLFAFPWLMVEQALHKAQHILYNTNKSWGIVILAAALIDRSMTNYWARVSGKGNRIIPRWRPKKKGKGHLSPRSKTNIYHSPLSRPPLFLIGHYLYVPHGLLCCRPTFRRKTAKKERVKHGQ